MEGIEMVNYDIALIREFLTLLLSYRKKKQSIYWYFCPYIGQNESSIDDNTIVAIIEANHAKYWAKWSKYNMRG